jgi:hypothetical protein
MCSYHPLCFLIINHGWNAIFGKKMLFFFAISKVESLLFCVVLPLYNPSILEIFYNTSIYKLSFDFNYYDSVIYNFTTRIGSYSGSNIETTLEMFIAGHYSKIYIIIKKGVNLCPNLNELHWVIVWSKQDCQ